MGQGLHRLRGLVETGHFSRDRARYALVDESGDLAKLIAADVCEQEPVHLAALLRLLADLVADVAEACDGQEHQRVQAGLAGERGVGDQRSRWLYRRA
ncbi:hypothetical protein [Streptomyces yerevanensis]|uniref:hypothetical protein n=1 Tax=Streptomyces yerevanensis TaxID=66378 RepID=UPI003CCBF682